MDKLTIEQLAPYLPFGLKVKFIGFEGESTYDLISIDVYSSCNIISENKFDNDNVGIDGLKPILRPLSDLTKEIEHKGEKFVPMVELYKIARGRYKDSNVKYWTALSTTSIVVEQEGYCNYIFSMVNSDCDVRLNPSYSFQLYSTNLFNDNPKTQMVQCWNLLFKKLFEWHFDVFGLIDADLAIDINTLDHA